MIRNSRSHVISYDELIIDATNPAIPPSPSWGNIKKFMAIRAKPIAVIVIGSISSIISTRTLISSGSFFCELSRTWVSVKPNFVNRCSFLSDIRGRTPWLGSCLTVQPGACVRNPFEVRMEWRKEMANTTNRAADDDSIEDRMVVSEKG